jgi:uncharacterized SAM-binding protein YcdF (DUF218 family)
MLAKILILPPAAQLLLLLLAWLMWNRKRRLARSCLVLSIFSLWLLSTPLFAHWLSGSIEPPALPPERLPGIGADAIVILGATLRSNSPEFGDGDYVSSRRGIERMRYGAFLHRKTGLPIAICGGSVDKRLDRSLAEYMGREMKDVFGLDVRWLETRSRITAENARFAYELLAPEGKTRIVLVTSAMHMRRATLLFEGVGFDVVQAPTAYSGGSAQLRWALLPMSYALDISNEALHEMLGYYYYRLAYSLGGMP